MKNMMVLWDVVRMFVEKVINERNSRHKRQTSYFLAYLLKLTSSVVKNNRYISRGDRRESITTMKGLIMKCEK